MGGGSMITFEKVITVNGRLVNRGEWDYQITTTEEIANPCELNPAPVDWDYGVKTVSTINSPLPEGAIEEDIEIFFDRSGTLRLVRDSASFEIESRIAAANIELAALMTDITLGLATDAQRALAVELRTFIKSA